MEKFLLSTERLLAGLLGSVLVPMFEYLYGTSETVMYTMSALLFFTTMDWISGTRASKKDKTYASKYGIDGIFRTFFILLLPAGGHLLDMIFGAPGIIFGLLSFGVLYHIIQSMTANSIRAGWGEWVPEWLLSKLTNWVKEEIESKLARSEKRKNDLTG
ncbi:phage holin family protein [Lederbergia wuyishanensis]|uniref:Phage-related holin n=1 Tax=Lederbergia wuyishanensis TaxID=1347903 RepID=A0ABU0D4G3_9BACI|nr:phage holin family protein [Lederbergia wuyishanensis]MCJ8008129.1 phage holin family protein [Lederbergia wuyishanensis]MDQ0343285.1 phage-related holin [Lederbergia wuyishanensis]